MSANVTKSYEWWQIWKADLKPMLISPHHLLNNLQQVWLHRAAASVMKLDIDCNTARRCTIFPHMINSWCTLWNEATQRKQSAYRRQLTANKLAFAAAVSPESWMMMVHGFTKVSSASLSDSKLQQASTLIILFTQEKMSVWKKNLILSIVITWGKVPVGIQKEKTLRSHLIPQRLLLDCYFWLH